jgi:hypothetical protein
VDYSSKAKSSNFRDLLLTKNIVVGAGAARAGEARAGAVNLGVFLQLNLSRTIVLQLIEHYWRQTERYHVSTKVSSWSRIWAGR